LLPVGSVPGVPGGGGPGERFLEFNEGDNACVVDLRPRSSGPSSRPKPGSRPAAAELGQRGSGDPGGARHPGQHDAAPGPPRVPHLAADGLCLGEFYRWSDNQYFLQVLTYVDVEPGAAQRLEIRVPVAELIPATWLPCSAMVASRQRACTADIVLDVELVGTDFRLCRTGCRWPSSRGGDGEFTANAWVPAGASDTTDLPEFVLVVGAYSRTWGPSR